VVAGAATVARADDTATADAAVARARQLVAAGDWDAACPLLATSYRASPVVATLVELAECHAHVGKAASAIAELRAAIATSPDATEHGRLAARVAELEAHVAKLRLVGPATAGLVVTVDGAVQAIGPDVPVDAGGHAVVATAPGRAAWRIEVTVRGDGVTAVTVPEPGLAAVDAPDTSPLPRTPDRVRFDVELGHDLPTGAAARSASISETVGAALTLVPGVNARLAAHLLGGAHDQFDVALDLERRVGPILGLTMWTGVGAGYAHATVDSGTTTIDDGAFAVEIRGGLGVPLGGFVFAASAMYVGAVAASGPRFGNVMIGGSMSYGF
jgi:hypothetical protein